MPLFYYYYVDGRGVASNTKTPFFLLLLLRCSFVVAFVGSIMAFMCIVSLTVNTRIRTQRACICRVYARWRAPRGAHLCLHDI